MISFNQPVSSTIIEPTGDSKMNLQVVIIGFEANLDQDTVHDTWFPEDRAIQGAVIEIRDHTWRKVIDVEGVPTTVFDELTIEIGVYVNPPGLWIPVRYLARGETALHPCPVPPSGLVNVTSEGTALLPAGVRLRTTYRSVATDGNKPYIHMMYRTWTAQ